MITTRLMSEDDKNDMRRGDVPTPVLELHITLWMEAGMPDYAHGSREPMIKEQSKEAEKKEDPTTLSMLSQ